MDFEHYLDQFQKAASLLDKNTCSEKQIEIAVGNVLNAVYLKLYKKKWANPSADPLTETSRIFFSIWIDDNAIQEQKIYYNIHAFKLRQLKGYTIQSRQFAALFRIDFQKYNHAWENVSIDFGPLTLMEGWVNTDSVSFKDQVMKLANNFLNIDHLIDHLLSGFKNNQALIK